MAVKLNILVFGASGFIGSKLAKFLFGRGDIVYVLARVKAPGDFLIQRLSGSENGVGTFKIEDSIRYTGTNSLQSLHLDYLVHAACGLVPSSSKQDFFSEYVSLIEPSFSLIDSCCELSIPFVYLSSAGAIYGDSRFSLSEESELKPGTFYGFSKYIVEQYVKRKHDAGLNYLILRPANVYGRNLDKVNSTQGLIENSILSIMRSSPIKQFGYDPKFRDYLFVDDFIEVTTRLLDSMVLNQTFNIGSGHLVEVNKVIEMIYEILKKEPDILITEERSFDKTVVDIDVSKMNKLVPYRPLGIYEGLSKYISQFDKNNFETTG